MTEQEEDVLLRYADKHDISDVMKVLMHSRNRYSKRKLKFFKWFCKWIPIVLMCAHGAAMLDFSQNHYDMFKPYDDNWMSYVFTYVMLYILPMVIVLASRFFYLCWRYQIPFFYFAGVNAIHLCYWSWYTTNEMAMAHRVLIVFIAGLYLWGFAELFFDTKIGRRICG